jgi:hypothetical protein
MAAPILAFNNMNLFVDPTQGPLLLSVDPSLLIPDNDNTHNNNNNNNNSNNDSNLTNNNNNMVLLLTTLFIKS